MPGRIIDVDFRKWPDTRHWQFGTEYIAEDDHGIWIAGRAGSPAQKGWDPPKTFGHGFVKLIVPGAWWTALWNTHGGIWVYVDIIAPAIWHGDRVKLLDLDLDVIISADGTVTKETIPYASVLLAEPGIATIADIERGKKLAVELDLVAAS